MLIHCYLQHSRLIVRVKTCVGHPQLGAPGVFVITSTKEVRTSTQPK